MEFFVGCKAQIFSIVVLLYFGHLYIKDGRRLNRLQGKEHCNRVYDVLYVMTFVAIAMDALSNYAAQHVGEVSQFANQLIHFVFYVSYILFCAMYFVYWMSLRTQEKRLSWKNHIYFVPAILVIGVVALYMPTVEIREGVYQNYSYGMAAYVGFAVAGLYLMAAIYAFYHNRRYIKKNQRNSLFMGIISAVTVIILQAVLPESLTMSLAALLMTTSIYLGIENPSVKMTELYHDEMLLGFSALLDRKDGGTGDHIRRTAEYATLIAREMGKDPRYEHVITSDYIAELRCAAPMHDIGKISVPDEILQKPGKLSPEEFEIMKAHSMEGAHIIEECFRHLEENEDRNMAYQVALYHHEKWNGTGYPYGVQRREIPLCARIMAVADVFDAVSADRCYRSALPIRECFRIIDAGRGKDFDPDVVDAFFAVKDSIIAVYHQYK